MLIIISQENAVKNFSSYQKCEDIDKVTKIFDYCYHTLSILAAKILRPTLLVELQRWDTQSGTAATIASPT
jgi:hypothetical protein